MKKIILVILFLLPNLSNAQIYEAGVSFGASNFIGDVGLEDYLIPTGMGGGVIVKYNLNPRIALRFNFTYIQVNGKDSASPNAFRKQRNIDFVNNVSEFALGTEFNFFEYSISSYFTPYILTQLAIFEYRTPRVLEGLKIKTKSSLGLAIPVGVGFKTRLSGKLAFAVEGGFRYTFKDDLDFTTDKIDGLNFGGQGRDFYWFSGISFVYTFGRPACYANPELFD